MARLKRFYVKDQPQHVIQRGNNREIIFVDSQDYEFYKECLLEACLRHGLTVHAYVLMTNHVHILASPGREDSLPKVFQSVGRKYVQYFNYTYMRTGTLWEERYKATLIDSESYLFTCMRYIELNPVRANMVKHPSEYPYSSYHANAMGRGDALVKHHELYFRLGANDLERQRYYRQLFNTALDKQEIDSIREATNKCWGAGKRRIQRED